MATNNKHEQWSSKATFLFATVGAAVGLGNLWRFPFVAGENGGGAFVLVYLFFVALFGIPLLVSELGIGRRGQKNPINSMQSISKHENANNGWSIVGWLSVGIPLISLSFYSVVGGWALYYILEAGMNSFDAIEGIKSKENFDSFVASPTQLFIAHTIFTGLAVLVVGRGIKNGIERIVKIMMPALFILLVIMVINSVLTADISAGLKFLFTPDFSKITPAVITMAMGQAFLSVGIGVGAMMTYGSYMPKKFSLTTSAATIAISDTLVAILAGVAIFPIVFEYGLDPSGGPELIFVTLPVAFGQMPLGYLLGLLFFILLFCAAFSTAVGMLEPTVAWLSDRGFSRPLMALIAGGSTWLLGIVFVLSYNIWADVRLFPNTPILKEKNLLELTDFIITNLFIPLNALLIALFVGWIMARKSMVNEIDLGDGLVFKIWHFAIRYIIPVAIIIIFVTNFQ
ncbi:sodium-dependent transporter [Pseudemcibacter aquimaris]|uniref:sodium-dependent transporter n=1 Tax=Pseudemcibacter aquimaris TaxID=2857064 RepID=UPI0020131659|nr:sodium-dependent transporter [Pseudemcibacter aquimaris]MCC3862430.1 sodium-dependent transporter [Pseudemcibacter aquimaris]WDU59140.1 sodium-dependent transporter [Pseudemcibacter aquimaris]